MEEWVVHVHFKDGILTEKGFRMTPMGQGEIDFAWIVKRLDEVGYEGDFALEYDPHATPAMPLAPPETGLRQWYEAFRAL
jgi:sugar phosphate isomerase/epimerase